MKASNLYLVRLFYQKKTLFVIIVVFIILNLAANFIFKSEQTPLFKWDLYAMSIPLQNEYSFLEIKYNGDKTLTFPHTWSEPQKLFFTNTLDYFIATKRNNNTDPMRNYFVNDWSVRHQYFKKIIAGVNIYNDADEIEKFPLWYKKYLEQHLHNSVWSIDVYEKKVAFEKNGDVKEISSALIYKLL